MPWAEEQAGRGTAIPGVPIRGMAMAMGQAPWYPCLQPAQLLLTALTLEQELVPLCSHPPWQRLCWGQRSALSTEASQPPLGSWLGKGDPGIVQGRLGSQPCPDQHYSPVCMGCTIVTSWGSTEELLSWRAPSSSQATLGCLWDFFHILR